MTTTKAAHRDARAYFNVSGCMRVTEMMLHGWDTARATGQSTDLDPELARECAEQFRRLRAGGRGAGMFADERPAPDDATEADRLAAASGREV